MELREFPAFERTLTTDIEVFIKQVKRKVQRRVETQYFAVVRIVALDIDYAIGVGWFTEQEAREQAERWVQEKFGVSA